MQVYQPMPPGGKPTEFNKYHHHHHDHHHHWTLTASQRRRIEAAEMKLLRPLAGHSLHDHKTNEYTRRELRITGILDKTDEYRRNWLSTFAKNATNPNPFEIIPLQTAEEGEQLEDLRSVGASSCNCGDGTDQRVRSLMVMMVMIMIITVS